MSCTSITPNVPTPSRHAFRRKLALIWAVGTLLPIAVLAMLHLLAPSTTAAADILRTANRFAGAIVLLHWAITLAVWAVTRATKTAARREAGWQTIEPARRASA